MCHCDAWNLERRSLADEPALRRSPLLIVVGAASLDRAIAAVWDAALARAPDGEG